MRFTLSWLREYLDFESSVDDLCHKLTSIGLEVENCINPKKDLEDFVISEIVGIEPHPDADKLKICNVNNGSKLLKVVCGASNVKKRMKTVLANIGCIIKPRKQNEFKIKKSKIRGIESNGMLCSEEELNLSDDSHGIIELDQKCKVGEKFSDHLSDENVEIEIAITPNRVDCAGVFGIARDLNAAGFGKLRKKKINKVKSIFKSSLKLTNTLKNETCPQFSIRQIKNVKNPQSSNAIIKRFKGSGLKVISSLVDITNYLTIDYCRPLHVFDYDKVEGDIKIRYSKKGEKFFGLDDKEYILDENMIVICDEKKIISLAGVIGGKNTACDHETKNILIESAYFSPEKIASTGRKLNITSDARYRFERGIDPKSTIDGIELASEMIIKNCGGEAGHIISDSIESEFNFEIEVDIDFFSQILGCEIDKTTINEKLLKIGCNVMDCKKTIKVQPPSWRPDIKIKEDLVEEIGRLIGYEKIQAKEFKLNNRFKAKVTSQYQQLRRQVRELLVSRNIMETISWSFSNKKWERELNLNNEILEITNPISSELSCLRTNLVGGLLDIINKNNNKNIQNISIFEMGPIFKGFKPGEQNDQLTVVRSGKANEKNWTTDNRDFDIFDLKSDLFNVLRLLKIPLQKLKIKPENKKYYHPGKSGLIILGEKKIASFGELHPSIAKIFKIKNITCLFELDMTTTLDLCKEKSYTKKQLTKSVFQSSVRDFSFEVDKNLLSIDLVNHIKNIDKEIISSVKVFDNYEGKDKRSLALEVIMQSDTKTLVEEDINKLSKKIIEQAGLKFNAKLK